MARRIAARSKRKTAAQSAIPDSVRRAWEKGRSVVPQVRSTKKPPFKWGPYKSRQATWDEMLQWNRRFSGADWAVVCGETSGIIVLDFDGAEGVELMERFGLNPTIRTPSGGYHVWLRWPGFNCSNGPLARGLELKSTLTATFYGEGRKPMPGRRLYEFGDLPAELQRLIKDRKRLENETRVSLPAEFTDYLSPNDLLEEAVDRLANGEGRNDAGFWLACALRDELQRYEDSEKRAWQVMRRYVRRVNADGEEPYTTQEAYDSLKSAFSQPPRLPRTLTDPAIFDREFKRQWAADKARQFIRSVKLGPFAIDDCEHAGEPEDLGALEFTIKDLQPKESNAVIIGQRKVGKTTLGLNLSRALLDGKLFLGRFGVREIAGSVGYLNYEMSERQFEMWVARSKIRDLDRLVRWSLRGRHVDLFNDDVFEVLVETLKRSEVEYLIGDPWARMIAGVANENSNEEVASYLERLDMLKDKAGIVDLALMTHMGKKKEGLGDETARGATRLEDWADVLWVMTKDGNDNRFLRAVGRDVDVGEFGLNFDVETVRLTPGESRQDKNLEDSILKVLGVLKNNQGIGHRNLRDEAKPMAKATFEKALREIKKRNLIVNRGQGNTSGHAYYLTKNGKAMIGA